MSMFDTVFVKCPNCGSMVSCQSKSGQCLMYTYTMNNVPDDVLFGLIGDSGYKQCHSCGNELVLEAKIASVTVKSKGVKNE
jgi:predicted RNA-binding Zn-ribbon protein involved in translation (DUF1610 family)